MKLNWCNGFMEIYAQLEEGGGGSIFHNYMCIVLYIYRSAMKCAMFGVAVLKASMLNWGVSICHGYMCNIYIYIYILYIYIYIYIYRSATRCAKFGVVVFKASMLD